MIDSILLVERPSSRSRRSATFCSRYDPWVVSIDSYRSNFLSGLGVLHVEVAAGPTSAVVGFEVLHVDVEIGCMTEPLHQRPRSGAIDLSASTIRAFKYRAHEGVSPELREETTGTGGPMIAARLRRRPVFVSVRDRVGPTND